MASIGISASTQRACSSQHITKKVSAEARHHVVTPNPNVEPLKLPQKQQHHQPPLDQQRFSDARWKNGTWDLNMFVKQGRMDWDSLIVAEAKRRKFLEVYPEASRNEEAVAFRSSIIPWWVWIVHSHLPEAELLNGRAAMVGFFMAYIVDAMTGLNVVGQTGNFICKVALLFTVVGLLLFRRKEDIENIKKLADEATYYDKQWQASWENPDTTTVVKDNSIKNNR
ncbi:light-harvesting complex-like protein 3 isotype 1, chloroplastic [Salvia miltiorrhiza]|uniref:light-harvesting complex-like protein 3 isotype 1, chloroplastic n=1 Tax=Salvia miltiorrhiza TaxID=226208 RepID=UPI0025AC128F|nr:light-harvesting complex-like protein 3 isotype 1, chloroplastic [Salvia miltiorrhiza]